MSILSYGTTAPAQDRRHVKLKYSLPDKTIEAQTLLKSPRIHPRPELEYYWTKGQRLMITRGGISGSVLDGPYWEYHANGQLMAHGVLHKGLRHGEWREWDEAGALRQITKWKHGDLRKKRVAFGGKGITQHKVGRSKQEGKRPSHKSDKKMDAVPKYKKERRNKEKKNPEPKRSKKDDGTHTLDRSLMGQPQV